MLLVGSLLIVGVTGLSSDVLNPFVHPDFLGAWFLTRLGPIVLALIYVATRRRAQSPLMDAFILLPAILTSLLLEYISLPPQIPWLIGLPLSYQVWAPLLWLSLVASLSANHLRESSETTQPLDYARRSLLSLSLLSLVGVWLLPAMGDTLQARSERWIESFQSSNLQNSFPYQTEATFWLETAGIALALLLFVTQTAFLHRSKTRHRATLLTTLFGILIWSALRSYADEDNLTLLSLSLRNTLFFMVTAIVAAHAAGCALLFWHLPVPKRPPNHPPSIRAELLAARMQYEETSRTKPALRKNLKRLVDRCHRALDKEAKSKGISPALWIPHRLQPGVGPESICSNNSSVPVGRARHFEHYLARGRRLEVIFCTWLLILGLGWSEWKANNIFVIAPTAEPSIYEPNHLWRAGLSAGLLSHEPPQTAAQKLAKTLAPNLKQDIIWKLKALESLHGIPGTETIFQMLAKCQDSLAPELQADCQATQLLEPLILSAIDTLEQAERTHRDKLGPSFRAPQMIRDLLPNHPDATALKISQIMAGQLASLDERFMARTALFAMILAAHDSPDSLRGRAANLTLNLLAPPDVLLARLSEDTRHLTARAQALYTVVFGTPPFYRTEKPGAASEQTGAPGL